MIKVTRVNNTVICFINSKMYQKNFDSDKETLEVYELIGNIDEQDVEEVNKLKKLFTPQPSPEEKKILDKIKEVEIESNEQQAILDFFNTEKNNPDSLFEVEGFKLYLKGINITIPEFLIKEFIKRKDNEEDTKSLSNFWRLLALNSDPRCRENLFTFLTKHELALTPSGYFVAYRNADVKQEGNKELNDFVTKMWLKVKTWKKSPKNYIVLTNNGDLEISLETQVSTDLFNQVIGNLQELYENNNTVDETVYTDHHSGTFNIRIGEMVSMPKEECDASQDQQCSRGLHIASSSWLSKNYYGSQGIVCLVNPMHVVSVP